MKRSRLYLSVLFIVMLPAIVTATSIARSRQGSDINGTLTINADGSSTLQSRSSQARAATEQQVRSWEQWIKRAEAAERDDPETEKAPTDEESKVDEPKPMEDKELETRLRAIYTQAEERAGDAAVAKKLDKVEISKDTVLFFSSQKFESLEDMLKQGNSVFSHSGLWFENIRFENDADGNLRITLTPYKGYGKNVAKEWKTSGSRTELKIVLPGKILSSGFPNSQDNATWIAIDGKDSQSVDAAMKLYEVPLVITAEPAGLKLAQALESKTLQRAAYRNVGDHEDIPVTDARAGFIVESTTLTTTTVQYFGEGETFLKKTAHYLDKPGLKIRAKMFPPKGSTIKSVSDIRVIKAVDNKDRTVPVTGEGENAEYNSSYSSSNKGKSANVELRLQLPPADAESIDELSAEAVAVTVGSWKEFVLTNAPAITNQEIDLAEIIPGAKATVTKASAKDGQFSAQMKITGPKAVKNLEFDLRVTGIDEVNSHFSERSSSGKADQVTRTVSVQGYAFSSDRKNVKEMDVVVKLPQDVRREKVKFQLTGLDLF